MMEAVALSGAIAPPWRNQRSSSAAAAPSLLLLPRHRQRQRRRHLLAAASPRCHSSPEHLDTPAEPPRPAAAGGSRRQVLAAGGAALAAGVAMMPGGAAWAAPVQPPNLRQCETPIDPGNGAAPVDCCLPVSPTITDFVLPTGLPLRTRPSAHAVDAAYTAKYARAVQLLRQLPSSDPRAYSQQANVHCAFCDAAYDENGTTIEYQVHNSWLFFPWHRWYLYFHERILASLIGDDSFAIPFWNWDAASGYTIPPIYASSAAAGNSLYDANRNPAHLPPRVVNLNYNFTENNLSPAAQLAANNSIMYRQLVTNSKTPSLFFGQPYRQGSAAAPGGGTVENVPHGTVHIWTGNPANPNDEDMGTLYSASRDPIFFAHHANIDRLWEVWKSQGGRRTDLTDPDYLNATFLFYDEKANLVRVRIGDALDPAKLAYRYQNVPNAWLTRSSSSSVANAALNSGPAGGVPPPAMAGKFRDKIKAELKEFKAELKEYKERAERKLEKIVSSLVRRARKVKESDFDEEILVLEGVEVPTDERVKFDVYINLPGPEAENAGCDVPEYAGSFFNVPRLGHKMGSDGHKKKLRKSNFRIGIGGVLKDLGIEDDDDFSVTIVQRTDTSIPVSVDKIRLEYE